MPRLKLRGLRAYEFVFKSTKRPAYHGAEIRAPSPKRLWRVGDRSGLRFFPPRVGNLRISREGGLKLILLSLIFVIFLSFLPNITAFAQPPLAQATPSSQPNQGPPTLESQTKKLTPLATPTVTINPQPAPQTPVSKPFWTSLSRCSLAAGLSCTSALIGTFVILVLISIAFWVKKLGDKKPNQ